jgi:hypothetical protein
MADDLEKRAHEWLEDHGLHGNTISCMADFARQIAREAMLERATRAVLEQRCERDTPWDLALLAAVEAIRKAAEELK